MLVKYNNQFLQYKARDETVHSTKIKKSSSKALKSYDDNSKTHETILNMNTSKNLQKKFSISANKQLYISVCESYR